MANLVHSLRVSLLSAFAVSLASCADGTGPELADSYRFLAVSAGSWHTCGIRANNSVLCWGDNSSGQLGDGTRDDRRVPTAVSAELQFTALSAGREHTCSLTQDGSAYCWGYNGSGQLGDGTDSTRLTPTAVTGDQRFTALSAGDYHTCGLAADGAAYCWGENREGQLGSDTADSEPHPMPSRVASEVTFTYLSAGNHTCGVTVDGTLFCWGWNVVGQLGDGTVETRLVPTPVAGDVRFTSVSVGSAYTCAIARDHSAYCWGTNHYGQLGFPAAEQCGSKAVCYRSAIPRQLSYNIAFDHIAAGTTHTCATSQDGTAYCWGNNRNGKLGDGTDTDHPAPGAVAVDVAFETISAGLHHTCGLSSEGMLYCWGLNHDGQLADDTGALSWWLPVLVWGW